MMNSEKKTNARKPSDYLRMKRPERYSDSLIVEEPQITRDILEYYLETLTNRSQEKEFEYFAKRLAEKAICPNLLPQTGPTGGGDSKVDTETYPVAEEISLRWYQGDAGGKDRWAFAISAKKDWKGKVRDDVRKIVKTKREYSLIYFITNQFVRDKIRAQIEDDLRDQYSISVRILDRSWIIDRILNHDEIDIAVQTLAIESLRLKPRKLLGPRDAKKEVELKELDGHIKDSDRYLGIPYQLAEDILRAAIIASELECNRHEVDGRFSSALRIAENVGDKRQILRIIYRHAWITCYVYDDIDELSRLYNRIEELGLTSDHAGDVELVNNLWNTLYGSIAHGHPINENPKLSERANALKKRLEELSNDEERPNNSLHAQTMLCFHKLKEALSNNSEPEEQLKGIFAEFVTIFERSRGLGQYPFASYKDIIFELGNLFIDNKDYEILFDTVVAIHEERTSEGEAAADITDRGIQKFKADKYYDAIRCFGKAQDKLIKEEYRYELIKCLVVCGASYKAVGLNWAARSNLLAALSTCITEFEGSGVMPPMSLHAAKELTWIEIVLGRVPHILFNIRLTNFISSHLQQNEEEIQKRYWEFLNHIDIIFSILLLRSTLDQLRSINKLPYLFDQLNLVCSEGALLFALGQINKLREDVWFKKDESIDKIEEFYELLSTQPASHDLPPLPELFLENNVELKTNVLGMELIAYVETNQISILIAESLLSALEAFLATSLNSGFMPYKQIAKIAIRTDKNLKNKFGIKLLKKSKNYELIVIHKENFELSSSDTVQKFREFVTDFILCLLSKITVLNDNDFNFEKFAKKENIFGRSLIFSNVITVSRNIFGSLDWINITKVPESINQEAYQLMRTSQWKPTKKLGEKQKEPLKFGNGEPTENMLNVEDLKHSERKVLSLINIPIWNKARWCGLFFMVNLEGRFPPYMGLAFRNENGAIQIFKEWRNLLSEKDNKDELRISIITGIDKRHPAHYRVHISTNLNAYERIISEQSHFVMVSRIHTMTPDSDKNLSMFLKTYEKFGEYCLLPAILEEDQVEPRIIKELFLYKKALIIKPAWQIGENDEDFTVLQLNDTPIIPEDEINAPVLKALARIQKMKEKK